ncbi:MAG: hypothetical protein LC799_23235 [Actinobacteria bacterium]|nr:hypothetical protein [Actinomycetota bacterium]
MRAAGLTSGRISPGQAAVVEEGTAGGVSGHDAGEDGTDDGDHRQDGGEQGTDDGNELAHGN